MYVSNIGDQIVIGTVYDVGTCTLFVLASVGCPKNVYVD